MPSNMTPTLLPALLALAPLVHFQGVTTLPLNEAAPEEPAPLADPEQPHGVLRFEILDHHDSPIPGRLTFVREAGVIDDLFPGTRARPTELAVRRNVVYTLSGKGAITVPVGTYSVYATRGIEWSLAAEKVTITEGDESTFRAVLAHSVSSPRWISGDFHLHTLTYSGHGDADLNERIISLVGEGVEFAVATDHNHNTDYAPTVEKLGVGKKVFTITGNEVSTPIGHLNAFPLEPDRQVPDPESRDAKSLFQMIRNEPNRYGITPVIQLNHPRWGGIDFFTKTELDPLTGTSTAQNYCDDFDTIEILNSNPGWGYHDADLPGEIPVGAGIHSVLQDWYNLLNRGHRYVAVGNSDSHCVHHNFAGYPRNYVQVPYDSPSRVTPAQVAQSLRAGRCYTTFGPVIHFRVNGEEMGGTAEAINGRVILEVRLQSPVWILVNRVKIVVNGDVLKTVEIEPGVRKDGRLHWPTVKEVVSLEHDSWINVLVESDESLDPIVNGADRPVFPMAITNPIRVEVDGDGRWTSPWDWAKLESGRRTTLGRLSPSDASLVVLASATMKRPQAIKTVLSGLVWDDRRVVLSSMRAAELLASPIFALPLQPIWRGAADPFLALTAARALAVCDPESGSERMVELLDRFGAEELRRYPAELAHLLPVEAVRAWKVLGSISDPTPGTLFEDEFVPLETNGQSDPGSWVDPVISESGYVDLETIVPTTGEGSILYARTWLHAPEAREVVYAFGSDSGCRMWLGDEEVLRDETRRGASPLQQVGRVKLAEGWNRILIAMEGGQGATGFYLHILDQAVKVAAERP
jgi:hypothetical protein